MSNRNITIKKITYGNPIAGVESGIKKGTLAILAEIAAHAKSLCPVDTGTLRASVGYMTSGESTTFFKNIKKIEPGTGYVGSPLDYATYQEFGTRYIKPQPYMRPSLALAKGVKAALLISKIQREEMRGALKKGEIRESFIL